MSTSTNNSSTIFIPPEVRDHDPLSTGPNTEALTEANRDARYPSLLKAYGEVDCRGVSRSNKRDLSAVDSSSEGSKDTSEESVAKKPANQETIEEDAKTTLDIDNKHADDPQYASTMASQLFSFLRHYETLVLPGTSEPIKPAKRYDNLEAIRMRCINQMFHINTFYTDRYHQVSTDTIHLAVYYLDRFLERYNDTRKYPMSLIALTALFTASKYEDVEPVPTSEYAKDNLFGRGLDQDKVLALEIPFQKTMFILAGPTTTAFALRYPHTQHTIIDFFGYSYLQAVDLETNKAAVHTARYFCALGVSCFGLSGEYYSKIGASAAFIAYNKYAPKVNTTVNTAEATSTPRVEYPQSLFIQSEYSARDIEPIVNAMLEMAVEVEAAGNKRSQPASLKDKLPMMIYVYYKHVAATTVLPNFAAFFESIRAEGVLSSSDKTEDKDDESNHEPVEQENPEEQ